MKILVLDNYDSFTYNLVQYIEQLSGSVPAVFRNDKIRLEEVDQFDKILLSPGPGLPAESGILMPLIERYAASKSILGICLGLQAINCVFGGKLINLDQVYHGVATPIQVLNPADPLFKGLPAILMAGRYHSWVADPQTFPEILEVTAVDSNQQIMALRHKTFDVCAVQFHPESILTPMGRNILANWIQS